MKKHLLFLSLALFGLSTIAQNSINPQANSFNNPFVITKGVGNIDGHSNTNFIYNYTGSDSLWAAAFANVNDNEALLIMYTKTTAANCVITFPDDIVSQQPDNMPGVTMKGTKFTLISAANGTFQFVIQKKDGKYTVIITRTSMQ